MILKHCISILSLISGRDGLVDILEDIARLGPVCKTAFSRHRPHPHRFDHQPSVESTKCFCTDNVKHY